MAAVLQGDRVVDYMLYGPPSERAVDFFRRQRDLIVSSGVELSKWAIESTKKYFDRFYSRKSIEEAKEFLRDTGGYFRDDILHRVKYNDYRPNLITQSYIMECPEVWDRRKKGMSNDFGNRYIDEEPKITDVKYRTKYLKAIEGIVEEDDDNNVYKFTSSSISTDESEDLSIKEQSVILQNWDIARYMMSVGEDPTDA